MRKILGILNLEDKNYQCVIHFRVNATSIKNILNPIAKIRTNNIPLFLEENGMKTITARSLEWCHVEKSNLDLLIRDCST